MNEPSQPTTPLGDLNESLSDTIITIRTTEDRTEAIYHTARYRFAHDMKN